MRALVEQAAAALADEVDAIVALFSAMENAGN